MLGIDLHPRSRDQTSEAPLVRTCVLVGGSLNGDGMTVVAASYMQSPSLVSHAVVVASPKATSNALLPYACRAVGSPLGVTVTLFVTSIMLGLVGAMAAVFTMLGVFVLGVGVARNDGVRRCLDRQTQRKARRRREAKRLAMLRPTGAVREQQYLDLRKLVEDGIDEAEATRFELQDLLDHFVQLAVCHQRCVEVLRLADCRELASPSSSDIAATRRCEIRARRVRHREGCVRQMARLADEIDSIDELVRLIVQRSACPAEITELDREIDRRLWELDEIDTAMKQLSSGELRSVDGDPRPASELVA